MTGVITTGKIKCRAPIEFVEDQAVGVELDGQLRQLLSRCFDKAMERRYFHEPPQWRWFMHGASGELIAHLAAHDKRIGTSGGEVQIAGIAEVCVHPDHRGHGLAQELLQAAHIWLAGKGIPVAMLFGETRYYASSGYVNIINPIRHQLPGSGTWMVEPFSHAMVKMLRSFEWPAGVVDLRGPTF